MLPQFRSNSRIRLLAILCLAIMAVFVMRLFYLQVIEHGRYSTLADNEQIKRLTIPAQRGEIYMMDDGNPVKVVLNNTVYTVFVDPQFIDDKQAVVKAIREIAGGNTVENFAKLVDRTDTRYQIVARNVSRKQAELMKERNLKGIGFQAVSERVYPEAKLGGQVLGFVNYEGKGQYGIEEEFNVALQGTDGMLQSVTDVGNVPLTIGDHNVDVPAKNGKDIVLTIDRNVQAFTERALRNGLRKLGAPYGSVLVMDPQNGKVLAMANLPDYNPGKYYTVQDARAFNNDIISDPYEPGSVIKTFTVATGINTGTITPQSTYTNTDYIDVEDRTITNATKGQTGTITFDHAYTWSLNTGMVTIAQRLGGGSINSKARTVMYDYFHDRFRLGEMTGIQLAGEVQGIIDQPNTGNGDAVRYSNMSFGQGMDPTMLQVGAAFSSVVNGGTYYHPTIIEGTVDADGKLVPAKQKTPDTNVVSQSTSEQVRNMAVRARKAFYAGSDKPGFTVGGKTGTSQAIVNGEYTFDETTGTYIGFGGDSKPRYVIMVRVSGPGLAIGGQDVIPIFTDISNWMIDYQKLEPKG